MPYELGRQYEVWDCPLCGGSTISMTKLKSVGSHEDAYDDGRS